MYKQVIYNRIIAGCLLYLLAIILLPEPTSQLSFGQSISPLSFSKFRQINSENYELVRTGKLSMLYKEYKYEFPDELQKQVEEEKKDFELIKEKILSDPAIPESQKTTIIADIEKNLPYKRKAELGKTEREFEVNRQYVFDLSSFKYRLDEKPTETNPDAGRPSLVTVTSEGTQIRYNKDIDQAVVDYFNGMVAQDLPAYLGVIEPRQIEMPNLNVRTETYDLDGHDVVVYELTMAGWNGKIRIYADPAIGYHYRKIEFFNNGQIRRTIVAKEYKLFDDILFPSWHEDKTYDKNVQNKVIKSNTIQIENANFNQVMDSEIFEISFTPETWITDSKVGIRYQPFLQLEAEDLPSFEVDDVIEKVIEYRVEQKELKNANKKDNSTKDNGKGEEKIDSFSPRIPHATSNVIRETGNSKSPFLFGSHSLIWGVIALIGIIALVFVIRIARTSEQDNRKGGPL